MLGHTGVGKTTYMASMYGVLQTPINGFSLRAQDTTHHDELLREFRKIGKGKYPDATVQRAEYNFSLLFQGDPVFPFQWVDYRGGALQERQENSDQARQLVQELQEADGIMVFCNADPKEHKKIRSQVARMTALVTQSLKNSTRPTTVAIVFTKSDLADKLDDLVDLMSNLFQAIRASKLHVGTMLPIACGAEPVNPEAPVLFALHFGITFQAIQLLIEVDHWKEVRQEYLEKGSTFWGGVGDLFNSMVGEATTSDYARAALARAEEKQRAINKLEKPAQLLGQYLEDWPVAMGEILRKMSS